MEGQREGPALTGAVGELQALPRTGASCVTYGDHSQRSLLAPKLDVGHRLRELPVTEQVPATWGQWSRV